MLLESLAISGGNEAGGRSRAPDFTGSFWTPASGSRLTSAQSTATSAYCKWL